MWTCFVTLYACISVACWTVSNSLLNLSTRVVSAQRLPLVMQHQSRERERERHTKSEGWGRPFAVNNVYACIYPCPIQEHTRVHFIVTEFLGIVLLGKSSTEN